LTSFDTDGFGVGTYENASSITYVGWNWLAANGTTSNTDGSITSTVSANPDAGFSIVTYTGNGSSSATVGHGLGVKPAMIILKARAGANANNHWYCWHQKLSSGYNILLSSTLGQLNTSSASSGVIAAPTNTTNFGFIAGSNLLNVNENNTTYVAYCFVEIEGYSKFGSYIGNGSTDGPFVFCGFKPALVLTKCSSNAGDDWRIWDNQRPGYNLTNLSLAPNTSAQEDTSPNNYAIDILSNGFKLRSLTTGTNGSGRTYIFMAFSENPFGGSGVSPATAR